MKYLITLILLPSILFANESIVAKAELKSLDGKAQGTIEFNQLEKSVKVTVKVEGLTMGDHGFHVHQYGDCSSADGKSAGGHFVGDGEVHAGPEMDHRHIGDLGNLTADNLGEVQVTFNDKKLSLSGRNNIIGRSVVIHAGPDDMESQPSGAAGGRVACGIIGLIS